MTDPTIHILDDSSLLSLHQPPEGVTSLSPADAAVVRNESP